MANNWDSGTWNINETSFESDFSNLKRQFEEMDKRLQDVLKGFISEMPEYKIIQRIVELEAIPARTTEQEDELNSLKDKTDYKTTDQFWNGISKNNSALDLELEDMIRYISDNYTKSIEEKSGQLMKDLLAERNTCITTCKELAVDVLNRQEEKIQDNQKIINAEKARLEKLQQDLETLETKKIQLEAEAIQHAPGSHEDAEITSQILATDNLIAKNKSDIDLLTIGANSITAHEQIQAEFVHQLNENKRQILQLCSKNGLDLQNDVRNTTQATQNGNQPGQNPQVQRNGTRTAQNATRANDAQEDIAQRDPRTVGKYILNNYYKESFPHEFIDGMGYGDIAETIKYLGPLNRRKLKNILLNRAEELGISKEYLKSQPQLADFEEIRDFLQNYDRKTPKEIADFQYGMDVLKYSALVQDASRGTIRRKFKEFFSRNDEKMHHFKQLLTEYADVRTERQEKSNEFSNRLRSGVGKPPVDNSRPITRGNRNPRNPLAQRDVHEL